MKELGAAVAVRVDVSGRRAARIELAESVEIVETLVPHESGVE
jgi:hypothetical protein